MLFTVSMTNISITVFDLFTIYWSCNLFPAILHGDGQFCYHFNTLLHYLVKWCIHSRAGSGTMGQFSKVQQVMLLSLKKSLCQTKKIETETTIMAYCVYPVLTYLDHKKLLFYF